MSISFTAKDSPRGADRVFDCCDHPECPHCKGTEEVRFETLEYDLNMSNANAWPFTALFTPDGEGDDCGIVEVDALPIAMQKLASFRLSHLSDSYILQRASQLLRVFQWATDNNKAISWG